MSKFKIIGTHLSFCVIEFNNPNASYLQNIMENELINYDKIFFERRAYKKLGYKSLEDLPIIKEISGFSLRTENTLGEEIDALFTFFNNKKKVFSSTLARLEANHHTSLFKEYCDVKSSITPLDFSFRKKKGCKYFLLKKKQVGTFRFESDERINLNQLFHKHSVYHFSKKHYQPLHLLEIFMDDSRLFFNGKKAKTLMSISTLR
jgi:hypothetical protein